MVTHSSSVAKAGLSATVLAGQYRLTGQGWWSFDVVWTIMFDWQMFTCSFQDKVFWNAWFQLKMEGHAWNSSTWEGGVRRIRSLRSAWDIWDPVSNKQTLVVCVKENATQAPWHMSVIRHSGEKTEIFVSRKDGGERRGRGEGVIRGTLEIRQKPLLS